MSRMAKSQQMQAKTAMEELNKKLAYCQTLIDSCDKLLANVSGAVRYQNLVRNELEFLRQVC